MTVDERLDRVDRQIEALVGAITAQSPQIQAHDHQIDALIQISEKNARNWENLERQWQAYLNTLPRQ